MKQKMCLIVRGFIYKENQKPISWRNKYFKNGFTLDFRNNIKHYKDLISSLSSKYDTYKIITTYDTTPKDILNKVIGDLEIDNVFLSEELNSKQFTTTLEAMEKIDLNNFDLFFLIRSDLIFKKKLFDLILDSHFSKDHIHVLSRESRHKKKLSYIDTMQIFSSNMSEKFLNHIRKLPRWLHDIHNFMPVKELDPSGGCYGTYRCHDYYSILPDIKEFH